MDKELYDLLNEEERQEVFDNQNLLMNFNLARATFRATVQALLASSSLNPQNMLFVDFKEYCDSEEAIYDNYLKDYTSL